jgi:hypothetical protein
LSGFPPLTVKVFVQEGKVPVRGRLDMLTRQFEGKAVHILLTGFTGLEGMVVHVVRGSLPLLFPEGSEDVILTVILSHAVCQKKGVFEKILVLIGEVFEHLGMRHFMESAGMPGVEIRMKPPSLTAAGRIMRMNVLGNVYFEGFVFPVKCAHVRISRLKCVSFPSPLYTRDV